MQAWAHAFARVHTQTKETETGWGRETERDKSLIERLREARNLVILYIRLPNIYKIKDNEPPKSYQRIM